MKMNTEEKATYLMELFKVPLLNENKRLAISFCDEMIKEWMNEGGRTAKQRYWKEIKTLIEEASENLNKSDVISMLPTDEDVEEFLKGGYMGFDETTIYLEQGFESGVRWVRETLMEKLEYLAENKITANSKILNEASENLDISNIIDMIKDIIDDEVYLRYVPYSMKDGDMEKDPDSVKAAAKAIVNMLKERGLI